jgi:ABC-2 type transport system ATP-binding protein
MKIVIDDLSKSFDGKTFALSHVNLVIESGVFGLVGPNASGKTTLLRILATLEKPTGGTVSFDGLDLNGNRAAVRSMTGYLSQRFGQFTKLKTWEFLDYSATLAGVHDKKTRQSEMEELLESLGLTAVRNVYANDLPTAMKRHLEIAQAVVGNPLILLVDEPTLGLSPDERIRFRNLLSLKSKKVENILITSHILSDISSTCDKVAVLDRGEVVHHGAPGDIALQEIMSGGGIEGVRKGGDSGCPPAPSPRTG